MTAAQPVRSADKTSRLGNRNECLAQIPIHRCPRPPSCSFLTIHPFIIERHPTGVQSYSDAPGGMCRRAKTPAGRIFRMPLPALLANTLDLPVLGSPLFIVSGPELVIAQCKAGIIGSFPALNARPAAMLDEWLHQITEELAAWDRDHPHTPAAPFAVNHIVHRSADRLEHDV